MRGSPLIPEIPCMSLKPRSPAPLRVVFVGASGFGYRAMQHLCKLPECQISGVITSKRTFSISYNQAGVTNVLHQDFTTAKQEYGLPVYVMQERMAEPELIAQIKTWAPDLLLVVGWYHMVPRVLRDICPAFGMHASLLPDYSGGAPLVWSIINGEKETGITLFRMEDGVDNGPILGQARVAIKARDSIADVYSQIEEKGLQLIAKYIPLLASENPTLIPQDEANRRVFPQRAPSDGVIKWDEMNAEQVFNWVRAQTKPYPGAFTLLGSQKLTIWWVEQIEIDSALKPGQAYFEQGQLIVGCRNNTAVKIVESDIDSSESRRLSLKYSKHCRILLGV